jgi:hypothetical protein
MRVLGLVYNSALALIDIKCGEADEVEESIKSILQSIKGIGVKVVCEGSKLCKAEVITSINSDVLRVKEYVIDGDEILYDSITKCIDGRVKLMELLQDVYRGGSDSKTLKSLYEFLVRV